MRCDSTVEVGYRNSALRGVGAILNLTGVLKHSEIQ